MDENAPIVYVVDDDRAIRESLESLLRSVGFRVSVFASGAEFLETKREDSPSCLILDVRLPGLGGLDLQSEISRSGIEVPVIFITGHGDIPMTVRAMKAGAIEFLTKPFREQDLLDAIAQAIQRDGDDRRARGEIAELQTRFETLTPREREVMQWVVAGLLNKQIANRLGVSEITVKTHRSQVVQKMKADSVADLVRMSERLNLPTAKV